MTLPENLRFRPIVEGDLDAVLAIERESDTAPHWERPKYLALIQPDSDSPFKRKAMVAEVSGSVVGLAIVRVLTGSEAGEAELESVVVAPDWRGQGLGTRLLSESARYARELGAARLDLEVRASNAAAIRLYERTGFQETGRRPGYYRGPDEDAVLMSVIL